MGKEGKSSPKRKAVTSPQKRSAAKRARPTDVLETVPEEQEGTELEVLEVKSLPSSHRGRRYSIEERMSLSEIFQQIRVVAESQDHGGSVITVCARFDEDEDKKLSRKEFDTMLRSLGFDVSPTVLSKLFGIFDLDHNGAISYFEFIRTISYDQGDLARLSKMWFRPHEMHRPAPLPPLTPHVAHAVPEVKAIPAYSPPVASQAVLSPSITPLPNEYTVKHVLEIIRDVLARKHHGGSVITVADEFDTDKDKRLSVLEFGRMLRALKFELSDALVQRIFNVFDLDHNDEIDYFEFIRTVSYGAGDDHEHATEVVQFSGPNSPASPQEVASPTKQSGNPPSPDKKRTKPSDRKALLEAFNEEEF